MADFRKWLLALPVVAQLIGLGNSSVCIPSASVGAVVVSAQPVVAATCADGFHRQTEVNLEDRQLGGAA